MQTELNLDHEMIVEVRALMRRIVGIIRVNTTEEDSDYDRYGIARMNE